MNVKMQDVKSSNIRAIGHDGDLTLTVDFVNNTRYYFAGVAPKVFIDMLNADSAGKFFHANIKNKYESYKICLPDPTQPALTHTGNMVQ